MGQTSRMENLVTALLTHISNLRLALEKLYEESIPAMGKKTTKSPHTRALNDRFKEKS
jgi:hypothetical protein